jgi:hypothetical protein
MIIYFTDSRATKQKSARKTSRTRIVEMDSGLYYIIYIGSKCVGNIDLQSQKNRATLSNEWLVEERSGDFGVFSKSIGVGGRGKARGETIQFLKISKILPGSQGSAPRSREGESISFVNP